MYLYRYNDETIRQNFDGPSTSDEQELIGSSSSRFSRSFKYIINCSIKEPNSITQNIVAVEVLLYCKYLIFIIVSSSIFNRHICRLFLILLNPESDRSNGKLLSVPAIHIHFRLRLNFQKSNFSLFVQPFYCRRQKMKDNDNQRRVLDLFTRLQQFIAFDVSLNKQSQ